MKGYQLIDHTADLGIEVSGASEKEVFEKSALAVFDLLTNSDRVSSRTTKRLTVEGMDRVDLLVNFLREVLYLYNGEGFLLKEIRIAEISETRIEADASGESYDPGRHTIKTELKAVTYHQAYVKKSDGLWKAQVIFDV